MYLPENVSQGSATPSDSPGAGRHARRDHLRSDNRRGRRDGATAMQAHEAEVPWQSGHPGVNTRQEPRASPRHGGKVRTKLEAPHGT
jgi:hypothetical protein